MLQDDVGDQARDVAAVLGDLLDQAGGQERVLRVRAHEQRLDASQPGVHLRHLQLIVEVADRAQAFDDRLDAVGPAEVDQQPMRRLDDDVGGASRMISNGLPDEVHPFVHGEQRVLVLVDPDGHHDLVKQLAGSQDDVEMAVRDGVEGTRTDSPPHDREPYQRTASPYPLERTSIRPSGQAGGADRRARSTTQTPPLSSQYRSTSRARTSPSLASSSAYGGSRNTMS